ncbi:ABC transporter [Exiguobacterium sp. SH31]|uniref:ABC transporter ATP-binding protein n=1 Tax=unclassified Exiguobacterium TaxID=2644629 RepID=UPI0008B26EF4|nr:MULTISPECIES: ABC transporter ATP-binding protein [unclassified Exiguobacterium]OGX78497.1 ABC transporter [Exiguobacterium sp. SH31]TCI69342.1 ABC transporter ATP-binding protein [Exiguobacterium sp. SH0S7]
MIQLEQVGKCYGDVWSLHPLDGAIADGRVVALCGSNGAGKSTLLNMLNGTLAPSVGHVSLNGETRDRRKSYNQSFGYMPDDFAFDPSWTVGETFAYYALLQGVKPDASLLNRVGLDAKTRQQVGMLSKGMRQRLLLAQALVTKPDILLLDEPTNGLDPTWMHVLGRLLREEADRGTTIVFSTHQLDVAARLADEVWMLDAGRLEGRVLVQDEQAAYAEIKNFFFEPEVEACQTDAARTK